MNKITKFLVSVVLGATLFVGCMTSKVTSTTPVSTLSTNSSGVVTTNTVLQTVTNTVVNQVNLLLDTAVLQGLTQTGVQYAVAKDKSIVPVLKDVSLGLNSVINGATTNTVDSVLAQLKVSTNPTINTEIVPVVNAINSYEQGLIAKYGTQVAGQIIIAVAKSVNTGLIAGLGSN